jgi:hypothetical protein
MKNIVPTPLSEIRVGKLKNAADHVELVVFRAMSVISKNITHFSHF